MDHPDVARLERQIGDLASRLQTRLGELDQVLKRWRRPRSSRGKARGLRRSIRRLRREIRRDMARWRRLCQEALRLQPA